MKKYFLIRKYFTIGVIFFFIGTCIVPAIQSEFPSEKTIITVDDEPGDADFTSIEEAVNASSPGDTIEVYSGMYPEEGIRILKNNSTLLGISHELGEGGDSGQPLIRGDGTALVIHIEASHVLVSNFLVENPGTRDTTLYGCISVGNRTVAFYEDLERNNVTISDCWIRNTPLEGIIIGDVGKNIRIINNEISNCTYGIVTVTQTHRFMTVSNITGNVIRDCFRVGIRFDDSRQNISGNKLRGCGTGIDLYNPAINNMIYGNDFENCSVGVMSGKGINTITKNNFKNYSLIACWFKRTFYSYFPGFALIEYLAQKDKWVGNYWDTWTGIGSKKILGTFEIWRHFFGYFFPIKILWVETDRSPSKDPYEIL
jgi:nitrous oxidase accessory protein